MIIAKKGAAYYLSFPAIDSATPASYKSGISPVDTAYYKDGAGAWTSLAITNTATEIGSTGVYEIDLTAAEMNHDKVIIKFAVSGMADDAYQFDLMAKLTDDLNDVAATDIVSDGTALDTTAGALDSVTLVATTTTNTDMAGTDGAALATVCTEARLSEMDAATGGKMANQVDVIQTDTTTDIPALIAALNDLSSADILTTALTESYSADGAAPTLSQAIFLIQQFQYERAASGTTVTVKKLDGSATAATLTLDSGTVPTSITRSS